MFSIYDGREEFYQWDIDRKIVVKDSTIQQVHFCNKTDDCSLVCEVYDLDGQRVADVPNILLTTDWRINVYGYTGDYTKHSECFKVNARTKPADYAYTETEVLNYLELEERIYNELNNHPTYDEIGEAINSELGTVIAEEVSTAIEEQGLITKEEFNEIAGGYVDIEGVQREIDSALLCYPMYDEIYTREEIDAKNALVITATGTTPSHTNAQIYEAAKNGRDIFLLLWGNTYLKATLIASTYAYFEGSYYSSAEVEGKNYYCVKYRLFSIQNDKVKENTCNLTRLDDYVALKNKVEKYEKPYELIQTFTLTEETKTIELDGFELDKYVVFITSPKSDVEGGCSYIVYKGDNRVYTGWVNQIISKSDKGTSMLTGENKNGMAFIAAYTSNYSYKSPWITPGYVEGVNPFTKISLIVNTTSTYSFQVGAKIELWGVRR
jgi:hypothetical protein